MNLQQLHKQFGTQDKCLAYLEKVRWGKNVVCPRCASDSIVKRVDSKRWHCNSCNKDFSVLYDTIFDGTKLELPKFFELIVLMINAKMGISASEISRNIGVKYQTAWFASHKVRCAMIQNELRLEGIVEFDEAYLGGKGKKNKANIGGESVSLKRGRGTSKTSVVGVAEKKGKVYVKIVEKLTGRNLLSILKKQVKTEDSIVITDDFRSYKAFDNEVEHITIKHSDGYGKGIKTINTIEGFWSILKNGIKGNYRAISKKYLPFYLAEFSYKFNQRHLQTDAFEKIIENAMITEKGMENYKPIEDPRKIVEGQHKANKSLSLHG